MYGGVDVFGLGEGFECGEVVVVYVGFGDDEIGWGVVVVECVGVGDFFVGVK